MMLLSCFFYRLCLFEHLWNTYIDTCIHYYQERQKSSWPAGPYALPTAIYGCPEEDSHGWNLMYINLSLPEGTKERHRWNDDNIYTVEPHLLGPYYTHTVQMNFCVKDKEQNKTGAWSSGQYCIYRAEYSCPAGELKLAMISGENKLLLENTSFTIKWPVISLLDSGKRKLSVRWVHQAYNIILVVDNQSSPLVWTFNISSCSIWSNQAHSVVMCLLHNQTQSTRSWLDSCLCFLEHVTLSRSMAKTLLVER